jgi:hypothetical protein
MAGMHEPTPPAQHGPVRMGTIRRRATVALKWWAKDSSSADSSNQQLASLVQAFLPHAEAVKSARKELWELFARMEGMQRTIDKASSSILEAASQVPTLDAFRPSIGGRAMAGGGNARTTCGGSLNAPVLTRPAVRRRRL